MLDDCGCTMHLLGFHFRYDEWEKYTKELESLDISVTNFTTTLTGIICSSGIYVYT